MSIKPEEKARLMKEFAIKEGDTGSPEVQVAILSSRIATLTEHFKTHKKEKYIETLEAKNISYKAEGSCKWIILLH